ncbi:MAG: HD domain-containing protein [Lachnospiraceae bacterium]|nr:HD domain-containing protein [Lachnospiraceae bacterium]
MDITELKESFRQYTDRMMEIRQLSSPLINKDDTAGDYSRRLKNNFRRIGQLASINRKMLDEELYPLLESSGPIDEALTEELEILAETLLTVAGASDDFENLDLPITSLISERLLNDAVEKKDIVMSIRRMDSELNACYSMMNMTQRITTNPQLAGFYKEKGISIGYEFLKLLDKDVFMSIPDTESRGIVLTNARFMTSFYERSSGNDEENSKNLEILDMMMDISEDSFYLDAMPEFDWQYFRFRVLEYYLQCTDIFNDRGFGPAALTHIADRADMMDMLCRSEKDTLSDIPGIDFIYINVARCRCLAGRLSKQEYRRIIVDAYYTRNKNDYDTDACYFNVLLPLEILSLLDRNNLSAEDALLIKDIYTGLTAYLFHCPNTGSLTFFLEYFTRIIENFIEIPSGVPFEEFALQCIAAVHPPTYIHSCMVGQITERLCYHLLKIDPGRFIGMPGIMTLNDVFKKSNSILDFAYHSALCHDIGKITIIDTIFIYGRRLLDLEFDIIKSHPRMGARLLAAHDSSAAYADVALMHHRWYNDKGGYPAEAASSASPYKTIIDLVLCADCMDAATDTIGRSYSKGKTLAEYMEELDAGAGTRYAPWLSELFSHKEVADDVEYILNEGRRRNYEETYNLLKSVQDKG